MAFLPINKQEMRERGWETCDFVYVIGDAYVDHPSFGHAIISRVLESHGYSVGIISQPDWRNPKSIDVFGRPRLGFLVSGGNMDSMVNHYSVSKRRRKTDAFTPGGCVGKRPDRATVCYCNLAICTCLIFNTCSFISIVQTIAPEVESCFCCRIILVLCYTMFVQLRSNTRSIICRSCQNCVIINRILTKLSEFKSTLVEHIDIYSLISPCVLFLTNSTNSTSTSCSNISLYAHANLNLLEIVLATS